MINLFFLLAAGLVALVLIYSRLDLWLRRRRFAASNGCQPLRQPRNLDPFLGIDHLPKVMKAAKNNRFLEFWDSGHFANIGNTFEINLMGNPIIMTNEPQNIHAVLASKFPDFEIGERRRALSVRFAGIGLLNADGQVWEHARALARPNFARSQIKLELFEKHLGTLDVASEFFFGPCPGTLHPQTTDLAQRFSWAFDVGSAAIAKSVRLGKLSWLYHDPDHEPACRIVHDYVDSIIAEALSKEKVSLQGDQSAHYTFLHALAEEGMSREKIRGQMLSILLAGRDTTACLMSAAMWEISRHPEMQARLRQEIDQHLGKRHPKLEDLKNMTYLNWFVKETLRLYPPVPINFRRAARDTWLPRGGGADGMAPIFVKKDQEIVYQIWSMHRRKDLWGDDAATFKPERWEKARPRFEFLPFNAGPRICLGQQFAWTEASYVLVRFLQEYSHIEGLNTTIPWTEKLTLTCCINQGVQVKLTKAV
ncbi:hypothetical protein McanMca71_001892 [Microsporum canis]